MSAFKYSGMYHVQSRLSEVYSEIEGNWYPDSEKLLDSKKVNDLMKKSVYWKGCSEVGCIPVL